MNILLISPKYPDTYWSFKHALKFISKKATNPPLGLLTVASLLPGDWNKKLVDLNVTSLKDKHILWADYVFIGAMSVQQESAKQVIERCRELDRKIVTGGPLFTGEPENYVDLVDHMILNEAEITLPMFLEDLAQDTPRKTYITEGYPEMSLSPTPDFSLIDISKYAQLNLQFSRGCPFDCEFCEITALLGHRFRIKSTEQIINELENIYQTGFKGNLFFVDDNFIGNRKMLKDDLLPAMIEWSGQRGDPFFYTTEASINLADDTDLMELMVQAGFGKVFVGIETPDEDSLVECNKNQNLQRDLISCVNRIQKAGIEVAAGFIVGFDNDTPGIFQRQIDFIQKSGIITAMVGLLNALNNTRLYKRLADEGRILERSSGDNTGYSINFIPKMDKELLMKGYDTIVRTIYSGKEYNERVIRFLKSYNPKIKQQTKINFSRLMALPRSIVLLGIFNEERKWYWKLFFWSLFNRPSTFSMAITYSIYGYHFRRVFRNLS
ncbi:B12-binding domain-containing radical SAM protein [Bacteroidota bacterium]